MPFNIGPGELILLAVVALLLFGPRRLPEIGRSVGEGIASFKRAMSSMAEVTSEPSRPAARAALRSREVDPPPEGSASSEEGRDPEVLPQA